MASAPTIHVGKTTAVLGDRFKERCTRLPQHTQDAWWQRTDYGWTCSHSRCTDKAGVNHPTLGEARSGADKHATEHPGATVHEVK